MIINLVGPGDKTYVLLVLAKLLQFSGDVCMVMFNQKAHALMEMDEEYDRYIGNITVTDEMSLASKYADDIDSVEYQDVLVVETSKGYSLVKSDVYLNFGMSVEDLRELGITDKDDVIDIVGLSDKTANKKAIRLGQIKEIDSWYEKCIEDKCLYGFKAGSGTMKILKMLEPYLNIPIKSMVSIMNRGIM